ncbi:MAG: fumarate hydratase C-terminal domain-containing protein [Geminicoccaceae bacterium]|nr:fumarate hydratase C-terminal domain-containing protein [Geminicoccaceae bacterium]
MKQHRLRIPVDDDGLNQLSPGDVVYLDGVVYTGREGLVRRMIDQGHDLPLDIGAVSNVNFHCSPAADVRDDGTYNVGAVTATASFRFSKWLQRFFEITRCRVIIGKGGMSPDDYREHFVPNGAVYFTTVGYGTGALLGRGIQRVQDVIWLEELGIAQAMWIFEVEKFGPFLVESDLAGNSLFEAQNATINQGIDRLYEGLKPPALKRYGETTSREDEVV